MRHATRPPAILATALLALVVGACGSPAPSAITPAPASAAGSAATMAPPTEVPGGASTQPAPQPTHVTTTQTDWGTILDAVPTTFPVFPGAQVAEPPAEPVSAAFVSTAPVDNVATWYRDALQAQGFATTSLSSPLEDGSRVLDSQGDLPECRIQVTFRPAGGSTMITVLYAAGCAGGEG